MKLVELVDAARSVAGTSSRKAKAERLARVWTRLAADEIRTAAHWMAGQLSGGKLGVGYATVRQLQVPPASQATLTIAEVDGTLRQVATESGSGSTRRRQDALRALLSRATLEEQDHLKKLWVGELRQGALESLVLDSLAQAARVSEASVRRAQMLAQDLGRVAEAALLEGEPGLSRFQLALFSPIQPMLAQPAESAEEAWRGLDDPILELKLDGARIQVHREGRDVRVYSRNGNDVTHAVPEVVEAAAALPVRSIVLDGETIALRPDGSPRPFQTTMRRFGRKLDVQTLRRDLPLSVFFFDCLYLDGDPLLDAKTGTRIEAQASVVPQEVTVERIRPGDLAQVEQFLRTAFDRGHEGAMLKSGAAAYEAGRRGAHWLKLKQAHTVDLVILAAEWGSGRRQGWLSNLHLGARSEDGYVMLGKTFKGLTDAMLKFQTEALLKLETHREGHVVHVRPELVAEIAYSDVQQSPHYPAGLALRFARVKRHRLDKTGAQATGLDRFHAHWDRIRGA